MTGNFLSLGARETKESVPETEIMQSQEAIISNSVEISNPQRQLNSRKSVIANIPNEKKKVFPVSSDTLRFKVPGIRTLGMKPKKISHFDVTEEAHD